jgi:hypothetical protein
VTLPPAVRYAGFIVVAEGLVALIIAAVLIIRAIDGADQHIVSGYGTAIWFVLIGSSVAAAGWALATGRRWGRGIAVPTNLLLLPIAWYVYTSNQVAYAIVLAVLAVLILGLMFSPAAVQWAASGRGAGKSGPDQS